MRAGHAARNLLEQRLLDLDELGGFSHVEDLLDLAEEHDLLLRARLGPVLEQAADHLLRQRRVLLQELDDAVGQLGVVQRQALDLVQRKQDLDQKLLVLHLERQGKAVDDAAEDLQQLAHSVKVLRLVDEAQENVVDLLADEGPQTQKLAVDPVQDSLQEITLPRVLTVKQFQQLQHTTNHNK